MKNECENYLMDLARAITGLKSSIGYYGVNEITDFENEYYRHYSSISSLINKINKECQLNIRHTNYYGSDDIILSGKSEIVVRKELDGIYNPLEEYIKLILNKELTDLLNDAKKSKNKEVNIDKTSNSHQIIINKSSGVVINSNDVTIDLQDSLNKIYQQLDNENPENKDEILEKLNELEEEFQKEEINKTKIQRCSDWLKENTKLNIPKIV